MMRKIIVFYIIGLFFLPGLCSGKSFLGRIFGKKIVGKEVLQGSRTVQGKIMLESFPKLPVTSPVMETWIVPQIQPTPFDDLETRILYEPTLSQKLELAARYEQTLREFNRFKAEMDGFLYYQSKPSERRTLHPQEVRKLLEEVEKIDFALARLGIFVQPMDPAFMRARSYVRRVQEEVAPVMKGMQRMEPLPRRTDRVFKAEEFFLDNPPGKFFRTAWWPGSAQRERKRLPKSGKIAVLNDLESVLSGCRKKHEKGLFMPGWELYTYSNAEDLIRIAKEKNFDVILSDILVPGGGGFFVGSQLRQNGFQGTLIALSGYREEVDFAFSLFESGFDGMIYFPSGFEFSPVWVGDVMQGLNNHFEYQKMYGWKH